MVASHEYLWEQNKGWVKAVESLLRVWSLVRVRGCGSGSIDRVYEYVSSPGNTCRHLSSNSMSVGAYTWVQYLRSMGSTNSLVQNRYTYNFPVALFVACHGSPIITCSIFPGGAELTLKIRTSSGSMRLRQYSRWCKSSHTAWFHTSKWMACPREWTPKSVRDAPVQVTLLLKRLLNCLVNTPCIVRIFVPSRDFSTAWSCQPRNDVPSYITRAT